MPNIQNSTEVYPEKNQKVSMLKRDLLLSAIVGLVCAILILPILKQVQFNLPYKFALIVILPILCVIGMFLAILIAQKIKVIYQLAKFVLVGALNTFVDWGILNLLMFLADITAGPLFSVFKGVSFIFGVTNSYFWNKFWTFKKVAIVPLASEDKKSVSKEVLQFFIVSLIGLGINVSIASLVVNVLGPQFGINAKLWANVGALCGTLAGLAWNFLGYKLIVFKR
jgi:putative flippase GtrA